MRLIALLALLAFPCFAAAQEREMIAPPKIVGTDEKPCVYLAEVNECRAKRGLRPFLFDKQLSQAAHACCKERAARGIEGHINDFSFLPAGAKCDAAGCGAWRPGTGWGTCCTYENFTYAGAAAYIGRDGRRYMHLFVRR